MRIFHIQIVLVKLLTITRKVQKQIAIVEIVLAIIGEASYGKIKNSIRNQRKEQAMHSFLIEKI